MFVIRPITLNDAEDFVNLAFESSIGLTSMPKNREALLQKVLEAQQSFSTTISRPSGELYLFVLEDLTTKQIVGTSGIVSQAAKKTPLYFYHIEQHQKETPLSQKITTVPIMRVVHYYNEPTEICSLYLSSRSRQKGNGRLLSLSRFLFIATFPQRFERNLFAEMRGYIDKENVSPFWNGVGRHFVDLEFEHLMQLRDEGIVDVQTLLPAHPIYISLLPKEVQETISKVHDKTQPALNILIQEGFQLSDEIDVFDGGPKIEAQAKEIRTIKYSRIDKVTEILSSIPTDTPLHLISNCQLDFRACFGAIKRIGENQISLSAEVADALKVNIGDSIRHILASGDPIERETQR